MRCEICGDNFIQTRAADPGAEKFIMLIWALRRILCRKCLDLMQIDWNQARWAARQGIPTIR